MGIYEAVQRRSKVFDPLHPKDPALARLFGGLRATLTGQRVDHETALSSTAMLAGVRFISENMASVPLPISMREGRGKKPLRDDRRWDLLNLAPNDEQTGMEFREMVIGFAVLTGNGYAEIVEAPDGIATALWPIPSWRVRPVRRGRGGLIYMVRIPGTEEEAPIPPERMLHVRGFSRNGVLGDDLIEHVREALGITLAADRAAAAFFGAGAQPSGILQTDSPLSDRAWDRLKKERDRIHGGVENWHRLALLEEGVKWQQISTDPEKSQLIDTRKFQVTEVARILNLPPHVLKDLERSTFSNIEHQGLELVTYSFRPWAVRIEQVLERRLLTLRERKTHLIRHNLEGFLRGDLATRYTAYSTGRQWGWLSANDVLDKEDQNGIGPQGDVYMAPINMVPADQFTELPGAGPPQPPPVADEPDDDEGEGEDEGDEANARRSAWREQRNARAALIRRRVEESWRPTFQQRLDDLVRREANAIRAALRKAERGGGMQEFRVWLDDFADANQVFMADNSRAMFLGLASQIYPLALSEVGQEEGQDIEAFVDDYAENFGTSEALSSRDQLRKLMAGTPLFEEAQAAIEQRVDEWEEKRAAKGAGSQVVNLGSASALLAFRHAGVTRKTWQTNAGACPLCETLQGRTVSLEGAFVGAGDEVNPEGDTAPLVVRQFLGHPQLHDGCTCTVVAGF